MSKQPTSLDYSTNAQGLLKTGVDLAGQKAKALKHKPTGYEAEATLFKNLRAGMTGKRKPWHQTVSEGLINGMEYGLQSKQVEAKKADYDKVENFFNYFEQTLARLNYDNNQVAEQTKLIENARPYAMGMLSNNFSNLSYEQANQSNQDLFQQAKLNNPNLKGDYVGFIPGTDNLLIRRENGEILPFNLATILPEEAIKDARQARIDQQNANSSQMQAQARMMSAHTGQVNAHTAQERWASEQRQQDELFPLKKEKMQQEINNLTKTPAENPYNSIPISTLGGRGMTPFMSTINAEIGLAKEVEPALKLLNDAEQLVNSEDYKKATGSGEIKGLNAALHGLFGSSRLPEDVRLKYERLEKDSSRVAEAFIKAKGGNISDSERETIKKGLFKPTNLDKTNQYNIRSVREELIRASLRGNFASDQLRQGFIATSESFDKYLAENPNLIEETKKKFGYQDTTKQESPTPVIDVSKFSPEQLQARKQQLMSKK